MISAVVNKRLRADYEKVLLLLRASGGTIELTSVNGTPPRDYEFTYHCRGIERLQGVNPVIRDVHRVKITLPANYPHEKPTVIMLTPIFHPHVFVNNTVCIGNWVINESLDNLILRIGAIIQYDPNYFDFRSPANPEAKNWAERYMHLFPIGKCSFRAVARAQGAIQWMNL